MQHVLGLKHKNNFFLVYENNHYHTRSMHTLTQLYQRKHDVSVVSMPYCIRNRFKNNWPKWQENGMLFEQSSRRKKTSFKNQN